MNENERPIGVTDSGVGGISVLRELVALMPNENFIYYGDSKNAPYGTKDLQEIQRLTCADAEFLVNHGAKALVIACNTATGAAIEILREKYQDKMPVIGIEPALKPASSVKKNPRILVMATPMALREEKFLKLMHRFDTEAEIIPLPCPGLVEFVERGELSGGGIEQYFKQLFHEYLIHPVDAVVLGCTHYPLVRDTIQKVLGSGVAVFDGGAGTARETLHQLKEHHLVNETGKAGKVTIYNSTEDEKMIELSRYLLKNR